MSAVDVLCISFLGCMTVGFFGWLLCVIGMAIKGKKELPKSLDIGATIFGIICIVSVIALFIVVIALKK